MPRTVVQLRRAFSRGDSRHEGVVTQDVSYNVQCVVTIFAVCSRVPLPVAV